MKLLIIGGTQFVGRALVTSALERGHEVTLFHRGRTNVDVFPQVERLLGDREHDLQVLAKRTWDAVIDTCGYVPRVVRLSVDALRDHVPHYTFISTISVYAEGNEANRDETAALATLADQSVEQVTGETYGGLKVLCEREVQQGYGDNTLIIRPGLIVGPHDPTNRFTYWVRRMMQGGEVLAPNHPDDAIQFIDVRDLADWTLHMVEQRLSGVFNAVGPDYRLSIGKLLTTCQQLAGIESHLTWVEDEFLLAHDVRPFTELPLWLPHAVRDGFTTINSQRAQNKGLSFRTLEDTISATYAWVKGLDQPPGHAGMDDQRQANLLALWRNISR